MSNYYIPKNDIHDLVAASNKLPLGSSITIPLDINEGTKIIATYTSTVKGNKVVTDINKAKTKTIEFDGEISSLSNDKKTSFKGNIYLASLNRPSKTKFSLRKNIVKKLNEINRNIKLKQLNQGILLYAYDELGRVYLTTEPNKKYYLDSTKNVCMDEDGKYYNLIYENGSYYLVLNPHIYYDYFDYYYLTKQDFKNDKIITSKEDFFLDPFKKPDIIYKRRIIDIRPYLNKKTR